MSDDRKPEATIKYYQKLVETLQERICSIREDAAVDHAIAQSRLKKNKEEASVQAKLLRQYLSKRYGEISIAACMQAVAFMHGYKSWHHLANGVREQKEGNTNEKIN